MPEINPKCNIFNKFLSEDLLKYTLVESGNALEIHYENGNTAQVTLDLAALSSIKTNYTPDPIQSNIWYPIFIDNDTHIKHKILSQNGASKNANSDFLSGRIGIENIISFAPQFKNWNVSGSANMSIDWILNQHDIPYYLNYGILCWFRQLKKDDSPSSNYSPLNATSLDRFPIGARLQTSSLPNITLIKLDSETFYRLDRDNHTFINGQWQHFDANKLATIKLRDLGDNPQNLTFYLAPESIASSTPLLLNDLSQWWIADGDYFSFYDSYQDQQMQRNSQIVGKPYISSSLNKYYTQIYHILTAHRPKTISQGMHLRELRLIKQLSMALSTSPFIGDFDINNLNTPAILQPMLDYINSGADRTLQNTTQEISHLRNILIQVSSAMSDTLTHMSDQNLTDNLVYSKKSFFKKLNNKYGSNLLISQDTTLTYNNTLKYGASLYLNQSSQSLLTKNTKGDRTALKSIYNNQSISIGNISINTNLSNTNSEISLDHDGKNSILPLSNITKDLSYSTDINIVMVDIGKVPLENRTDGLDLASIRNADPQIAVFQANFFSVPYIIKFSVLQLPFDLTPEQYSETENSFSYLWEQIEGDDKLFFSDQNITGAKDFNPVTDRFETSSHSSPFVIINNQYGGRFTIQCTVSGPYGSYIKKKTFFVVDGRQQVIRQVPGGGRRKEQNGNYGKYGDPSFPQFLVTPDVNDAVIIQDSFAITSKSDFLKVSLGVLSEIAVEKGGTFWPLQTNLICRTAVDNKTNSFLSGKAKFYFGDTAVTQMSSGAPLSIKYIPADTHIKLMAIKLSNIRNNIPDSECEDCLSMFEPLQLSTRSPIPGSQPLEFREKIVRGYKYNDELSLAHFESRAGGKAEQIGEINFPFPRISTTKAPHIKSYGGYNKTAIDNIGINIPDLPIPEDISSDGEIRSQGSPILPNITGYNLLNEMDDPRPEGLDNKNNLKLCYQKAIRSDAEIIFDKGVFHPASGWIKHSTSQFDEHKNLSSVLKFNPGARKSYSFTGPGLFGLKAMYDRTTFENKPAVYTSHITISIAGTVQWEPLCFCPSDLNQSDQDGNQQSTTTVESIKQELLSTNQVNREMIDQYVGGSTNLHHGYRYLYGGQPKLAELKSSRGQVVTEKMDEFNLVSKQIVFESASTPTAINYGSSYLYEFTVSGPNRQITPENIQNKNLRDPRINTLSVRDLEVKLNFLNISNTKNIIVVFDKGNDIFDPEDFKPDPNDDRCKIRYAGGLAFTNNTFFPVYADETFIQCDSFIDDTPAYINPELKAYINGWLALNPISNSSRVCLLNQEHIQYNKYNFSLLFSDYAPHHNVAYDQNLFNISYPNSKQNIVRDGHMIQPSMSALGYSDRESAIYQKIIRQNELSLITTSFAKFRNSSLFGGETGSLGCGRDQPPRQREGALDGAFRCNLRIIVVEELDTMQSLDMVINNNLLNGYDTPDVINKSSDINNSLCSWELILHTEKSRSFVPDNAGSLSSYGNSDVLALIEYGNEPRYPGYGFVADLKNKQYLLPTVNINAPFNYINDYALCDFVDPINKPITSRLRSPIFPTSAIIGIAASVFQGTTGSIIGTATSPGVGYNQGFAAIIDYFNQNRFIESVASTARNIYAPNYDNFPFGSAEKILINASKSGGIWYKMEVPIFRYSNCPILQDNRYKFIKISKDTSQYLSIYNFENVRTIEDLLSNDFILDISQEILSIIEPNNNEPPTEPTNPTIEQILGIEAVQNLSQGSIISYTIPQQDKQYYIKTTSSELTSISTPKDLLRSEAVLAQNSMLHLFPEELSDVNLISIESKIAYYIFDIGDTIEHYTDPQNAVESKITGKALIYKNGKHYTILNLSSDISESSTIARISQDTIMVFKPQTTKDINGDMPFNAWGLEKPRLQDSAPDIVKSTTGLGSYGNASIFKYKNFLTNNFRSNQLKTIYDIFDNNHNNLIKFNDMNIIADGRIVPIANVDGAKGYAFSVKEIQSEKFHTNTNIVRSASIDDIVYEKLLSDLKNTAVNAEHEPYQIMLIKCQAFIDKLQYVIPADPAEGIPEDQIINIKHGDITFEQDFINLQVTNNLSQQDITKIVGRINTLSSENTTIAKNIGSAGGTKTVIDRGSIIDLQNHYNLLRNDPIDCYKSYNLGSCPKIATKQAIYNRTYEKNELIKLLENQAIAIKDFVSQDGEESLPNIGNISYKAKDDNSYIIPQTTVSLITNSDGSMSINYINTADSLYWINIDPKQSCTLAEDATVKVLKKTVYECRYANVLQAAPGRELIPNNNVCINRNLNLQPGVDESVNYKGAGEIEYVISETKVFQQKQEYEQKYPDIFDWKEYVIERNFMINNDEGDGLPTEDIAVTAKEFYDLAIPCFMTEKGRSCNDLKNDGSADMNEASGTFKLSAKPCIFLPTTKGFGLVDDTGYRSPIPTRVYNVFNLDDVNQLKVQFRKVPRQLRGVDFLTTVYKYGKDGSTYRPLSTVLAPLELTIGQTLNNNFYHWHCIQADKNYRVVAATTPDFLSYQNEMIFRSFYGSVDNIENKDNLISLFPFEIIPYEYDT